MIKTHGQWHVHPKASEITGITNGIADEFGTELLSAYEVWLDYVAAADVLVAHNANFDITVMRHAGAVYAKQTGTEYRDPFKDKKVVCTMLACIDLVKATPKRRGQWKWPKLEECTMKFFGTKIDGAHDAMIDVRATAQVFYYLMDTGVFEREQSRINR
jgi:DNA polymerase III epsilon subunit-like protein